VRDATGDRREAEIHYRKALYLDPHHEEALVHLALLMETQDKKAEAQVLRARATRGRQKSGA
jgi:chemotaxis protein methyltransferase WspC